MHLFLGWPLLQRRSPLHLRGPGGADGGGRDRPSGRGQAALHGCFRPARQQNLSKVSKLAVLAGKAPRSSPGATASLVPGSVAAGVRGSSSANRQLCLEVYLQPAKLAGGMRTSPRAREGKEIFPSGACLHGVVAPLSRAPSVTLLSAGHGKARCLPKNPTGIRRLRRALPSASPTPSRPPSGTALLYF